MKICVISDIHCKSRQNADAFSDTLLLTNKPRVPACQHPVAALIALIKEDKLKADLLLCPGDLGDRADEHGIAFSWTILQEIKTKIGAELMIAIPGNHDVNSRMQHDKEPFEFIKNFHEDFPVTDDLLKSKFWNDGYCLLELNDCLLVLINSVHDHTTAEKGNQATLKPETLSRLQGELKTLALSKFKFKICMLHHHPIKHSNILNWRDTDSLDKGDELVALLNSFRFNIIIHGHKHQPRILEYSTLPIFAAGSFSSIANIYEATGLSTMFHIVELSERSSKGQIHSWSFDIVNGWTKKDNNYFPPEIGFGSDLSVEDTAQKIDEIFTRNGRKQLFYDYIQAEIQELNFFIPDKLVQLKNVLKERYGIKMTPEYPLTPIKVSGILNN